MTEDLQQLLDRIRREGVEKAETEAKAIVEAARKEAAETLAKAKTEAEGLRKEAEKDAKAFAQRAEQQAGKLYHEGKNNVLIHDTDALAGDADGPGDLCRVVVHQNDVRCFDRGV